VGYSKKMPFKNANYKQQCLMPVEPIDECDNDNEECPNHPDLLLLREAAVDERNAIAFYLRSAQVTCLDSLFLDVAEDEMQHFIQTMLLISSLDPVQAEAFENENLPFLTMPRRPKQMTAKWQPPEPENIVEDVVITPPSLDELATVDILTKAIGDELMAINKYQRFMSEATLPEVRDLFCQLMNEEKEHVAEFIKALFCITHEPLPHELD
jgi:rubrerythrin